MESRISATEAARKFSDLLNRLRYRGDSFVIHRGGEDVGRLIPVAPVAVTFQALVELVDRLPQVDVGFLDEVENLQHNQPSVEFPSWD